MKKIIWCTFFIVIFLNTHFLNAQHGYLPIENNILNPYINSVYRQQKYHTAIKPYRYRKVKSAVDSFGSYSKSQIFAMKRKILQLKFYPLYYFDLLQDIKNTQTYLNFRAGFNIDIQIGRKLIIGSDIIYAFSSYPRYLISHPDNTQPPDSTKILPYYGDYLHKADNSFGHNPSTFYIDYTLSPIFNFTAGYGKNYFGDGYRSLLLSNNSNNYLYFKTSVDVWRFKYVHIVAGLKDVSFMLQPGKTEEEEGGVELQIGLNNFKRKYAYIHFLSWNATKRLNINVFEAILQNAEDSIGRRGLDVNYINPIVFFRPVEISVGSPDNAVMGVGFKYSLHSACQIYGQAVLDEFILSDLKQNKGSWTNKYGFQIGMRINQVKKIPLSAFFEFNYVRPFVYSHENPLQNYGHYFQPLTHPLHANFKEWVGKLQYEYRAITLSSKILYAKYGVDNESSNVGHDIYKSYHTRMNFDMQRDVGYTMLNGNQNTQVSTDLKAEYNFSSKKFYGLKAFGGMTINVLQNNTSDEQYISFYFGAKTPLSVVREIEYIRNW